MTRLRRAFTLIEVLVAIGVMGVLIGLLLSAVQVVRGTAARAACQNNLKQIALAAQNYHDTRGSLPASYAPFDGISNSLTTWPVRLLPYLDQVPLWQQTIWAYRVTLDVNQNPPHVGRTIVLKMYACPADHRLTEPITDDRGYTAAYGSYEGVGGGVSRSMGGYDGAMRALTGVRLTEVSDGTSNTLLVGERPPWGRLYCGTWYGTAIPNDEVFNDPTWAGGTISSIHVFRGDNWRGCRGPFRFGPGRLDNRCDVLHFWSLHSGGANFAFCDGSVRFLPYSAEPVMVPLATRAGGEVVTVPD